MSTHIMNTDPEIIANLIADLLKHPDDETKINNARGTVAEICAAFPLYRKIDE